jgi:hypothetical protein
VPIWSQYLHVHLILPIKESGLKFDFLSQSPMTLLICEPSFTFGHLINNLASSVTDIKLLVEFPGIQVHIMIKRISICIASINTGLYACYVAIHSHTFIACSLGIWLPIIKTHSNQSTFEAKIVLHVKQKSCGLLKSLSMEDIILNSNCEGGI